MRYLDELVCASARRISHAYVSVPGGSVRTAIKSESSNVRRVFNFGTDVCADIGYSAVCLRDPRSDKRFLVGETCKTTGGVSSSFV